MKYRNHKQQAPDRKAPPANAGRRKAIETIAGAVTLLAAHMFLPTRWDKPVIESIFLPAHAATSGAPPEPPEEERSCQPKAYVVNVTPFDIELSLAVSYANGMLESLDLLIRSGERYVLTMQRRKVYRIYLSLVDDYDINDPRPFDVTLNRFIAPIFTPGSVILAATFIPNHSGAAAYLQELIS